MRYLTDMSYEWFPDIRNVMISNDQSMVRITMDDGEKFRNVQMRVIEGRLRVIENSVKDL